LQIITVICPEDYASAHDTFTAFGVHTHTAQNEPAQDQAWASNNDNNEATAQRATGTNASFPIEIGVELCNVRFTLRIDISIADLATNARNGACIPGIRRSVADLLNRIANALFPVDNQGGAPW